MGKVTPTPHAGRQGDRSDSCRRAGHGGRAPLPLEIGWARSAWDAIKRFSSGGSYVNFAGLGEDAGELRSAVYGWHEERLERVRAAYDPEGLFAPAARRP
ncbi:hypothetical protein GCM10009535_33000 [Streptomyces thermocarboxydovorans]|uniref:Berberine/berberine-like domain-containing protein n=1 Tax=Streptomyces thermocarboxydovorans TaxID=59298 RepID=A0ABP3SSU7_9ACTN